MDYDRLAEVYEAHRTADRTVVVALATQADVGPDARVLEVGCGTGNHISALRAATGCEAWGVEPSSEMRARVRDPGLAVVGGAAEELPFGDGVFDLAFSVDVVHHLADLDAALGEAHRVLRPGGSLCLATDDEETIRSRLHSRYFPETVAVELARYPSGETVRDALAAAGFGSVREMRTAVAYTVSDSRAYRDGAFSSLLLIDDEAHAAGLERLERDLAAGPLEAVASHVLLWARRPDAVRSS
ncbi:MAG: class I SAM-dependent methyltransferase [Gaiellaceae bacterium]